MRPSRRTPARPPSTGCAASGWGSPTPALYGGGPFERARYLARSRTHVHPNEPLRALLTEQLGAGLIEDLAVPFQCVAASIERAAEHWFSDRPRRRRGARQQRRARRAAARCGSADETYLDGGLVNSIPVERALQLGARTLYVLQVGRIDRPLTAPTRPWEVAAVSFEIARRHRFARDMATLPADATVHVLPTGADEPPRYGNLSSLKYRDFQAVERRIESARRATTDYLRSAPERAG